MFDFPEGSIFMEQIAQKANISFLRSAGWFTFERLLKQKT